MPKTFHSRDGSPEHPRAAERACSAIRGHLCSRKQEGISAKRRRVSRSNATVSFHHTRVCWTYGGVLRVVEFWASKQHGVLLKSEQTCSVEQISSLSWLVKCSDRRFKLKNEVGKV